MLAFMGHVANLASEKALADNAQPRGPLFGALSELAALSSDPLRDRELLELVAQETALMGRRHPRLLV